MAACKNLHTVLIWEAAISGMVAVGTSKLQRFNVGLYAFKTRHQSTMAYAKLF